MSASARILFVAAVLAIVRLEASSQWTSTYGPIGGAVSSLATGASAVFAGTSSGVIVSLDNGASWNPASGALPAGYTTVLAADGSNVIAVGSGASNYLSHDNGGSWAPLGPGIPSVAVCAAISGSTILVGTTSSVYLSTDGGITWTPSNSGFKTVAPRLGGLAISGANAFAIDSGQVYSSPLGSINWTRLNTSLPQLVYRIAVSGSVIFASPYTRGVFVSTDNGATWASHNSGMADSSITALALSGSTVYALSSNYATSAAHVYMSSDSAKTWKNSGLILSPGSALTVSGSRPLVGTSAGIFVPSTTLGLWQLSNAGLVGLGNVIHALAPVNGVLFAGTGEGLYASTDNGSTWSLASTPFNSARVDWIVASPPNVLAANDLGSGINMIALSKDNGTTWDLAGSNIAYDVTGVQMSPGPTETSPLTLYASTVGGGVYTSVDTGKSWTQSNNGLPSTLQVYSLSATSASVFALTDSGIYATSNSGSSWTKSSTGLFNAVVSWLGEAAGTLFANTTTGYLYKSTNNGGQWIQVARFASTPVTAVTPGFLSTTTGPLTYYTSVLPLGIYISDDYGQDWAPFNPVLLDTVTSLAVAGTTLIAGTYHGPYVLQLASWEPSNSGYLGSAVLALSAGLPGPDLLAGTNGGGVFRFGNSGWSGPAPGVPPDYTVFAFASTGGTRFAGTSGPAQGGVFASVDSGNTWQARDNGLPQFAGVRALTSQGADLYAGMGGGGVYYSSNFGGLWSAFPSAGYPSGNTYSLVFDYQRGSASPTLFAGGNFGVYLYDAAHFDWLGLLDAYVRAVAVADSSLFAATAGYGVYALYKGFNLNIPVWDSLVTGLTNKNVDALIVVDTFLVAGTDAGGLFINGIHQNAWMAINQGLPNLSIGSLATDASTLYAGTGGAGVWSRSLPDILARATPVARHAAFVNHTGPFSFNDPLNTTAVSINFTSLTDSGLVTVARFGTGAENLSFTGNAPAYASPYRWVILNSGITSFTATLSVDPTMLPPGIVLPDSVTVFKRSTIGSGQFVAVPTTYDPVAHQLQITITSFSEFILGSNSPLTSVTSETPLPRTFRLEQNYPNPFNPSTSISYQLPKAAFVTISVFDILGREVVTLVNETEQPGAHVVRWNAAPFASGVYFYRIAAGSFVSTKKMVLLK